MTGVCPVKRFADSSDDEFVYRAVLLSVERQQPFGNLSLMFIDEIKTYIQPINFAAVHILASALICASARYSYPFAAAQISSTNFTRSALNR